jgi:hypothetical protein
MSAFSGLPAVPRHRPSAALLIALPLLAGLVGAILAMAFGQDAGHAPARASAPPAGRTVSAGDLRLVLPEGWTPASHAAGIPGFEGARTAFARTWNADVTIALLPAVNRSLLPRGPGGAKWSRPQVMRAGTLRAYHYFGDPSAKTVRDVIVVPTTLGVATIACSSPVIAPGECDPALRGLRLARGSFLPLSPDAAFLSRLPAVAASLDAERVRLRARLAGAALPGEALRAADGLAGAYAAAARALRPLAVPHGPAAATVWLLDTLRARYRALGHALPAGDSVAFAQSARAIDSVEGRLAARLQAWQRALAPRAGR